MEISFAQGIGAQGFGVKERQDGSVFLPTHQAPGILNREKPCIGFTVLPNPAIATR
jgi:hypothetical protein